MKYYRRCREGEDLDAYAKELAEFREAERIRRRAKAERDRNKKRALEAERLMQHLGSDSAVGAKDSISNLLQFWEYVIVEYENIPVLVAEVIIVKNVPFLVVMRNGIPNSMLNLLQPNWKNVICSKLNNEPSKSSLEAIKLLRKHCKQLLEGVKSNEV